MSQENVEVANVVVRRWIWAFDNDTDAFRDILHPEIEWFPIEENHTPYYGVEAAMRYRNRWFDTWDDYRTELEEVVEGGAIRNGAVERVTMYQERQDALEAVGLSEQDAHADS